MFFSIEIFSYSTVEILFNGAFQCLNPVFSFFKKEESRSNNLTCIFIAAFLTHIARKSSHQC